MKNNIETLISNYKGKVDKGKKIKIFIDFE